LPPHPEDHPREDGDGREGHEALEDLFGLPLELGSGGEDRRADSRGEEKRDSGAPPDQTGAIGRPELLQIGQDDRDDEGGLDPLP
jgi:hypothetical protein